MTAHLELPFKVEAPRRVLLAPLRASIVRQQDKARRQAAALAEFNDRQGSPLEDGISTAIEQLSPAWLHNAAGDCRRCAYRATRRDQRDGYDTWRARDLADLIKQLDAMAHTLDHLGFALAELATAEAEEIAELTTKMATA